MVFIPTSEVAPPRHRGRVCVSYGVGNALGMLSQALIVFGLHALPGGAAWHLKTTVAGWVAVVMLCILLPGGVAMDSPACLAMRGRLLEAREALQLLRPPLRAKQVRCGAVLVSVAAGWWCSLCMYLCVSLADYINLHHHTPKQQPRPRPSLARCCASARPRHTRASTAAAAGARAGGAAGCRARCSRRSSRSSRSRRACCSSRSTRRRSSATP